MYESRQGFKQTQYYFCRYESLNDQGIEYFFLPRSSSSFFSPSGPQGGHYVSKVRQRQTHGEGEDGQFADRWICRKSQNLPSSFCTCGTETFLRCRQRRNRRSPFTLTSLCLPSPSLTLRHPHLAKSLHPVRGVLQVEGQTDRQTGSQEVRQLHSDWMTLSENDFKMLYILENIQTKLELCLYNLYLDIEEDKCADLH